MKSNHLYLIVDREGKFKNIWRGKQLIVLHTHLEVLNKIMQFKNQMIFVKPKSKNKVVCSCIFEKSHQREDGTYDVHFKNHDVTERLVPKDFRSHGKAYFEGPEPIKYDDED